jgi:two-component system chemotaxis sensor kinase CheA
MADPIRDIRASFFAECDELLEALQDGLEAIEAGAQDPETVNGAFRAVHSIKGGAGAFGLDDLVGFAHVFETALDALRAGRIRAGRDAMRLFFAGGDLLWDLAHAARSDRAPDMERLGPLADALDRLAGGAAAPRAMETARPVFTPTTITIGIDPDPGGDAGSAATNRRFLTRGLTLRSRPDARPSEADRLRRARPGRRGPTADGDHDPLPELDACDPPAALTGPDLCHDTFASTDHARESLDVTAGRCGLEIDDAATRGRALPAPWPADAAPAEPASRGSRAAPVPPETANSVAQATLRVDLRRIDSLAALVAELAVSQTALARAVADAGAATDEDVAQGLNTALQLTRNLQESVHLIRAQPVKPLFQRMSRVLREAATAAGKDVCLRTGGDATEIDTAVIERLAAPLTHLIRNAVDHGVEPPEERCLAGKPPRGVITLSACPRASRIVVEIGDDGRGIDRPGVRRIAERAGLIGSAESLSDAAADELLFVPGLSTATAVSNLSGRGVGLDVVRNAIASLGGNIAITSAPGRGTLFRISLPLTPAARNGTAARVASDRPITSPGTPVIKRRGHRDLRRAPRGGLDQRQPPARVD